MAFLHRSVLTFFLYLFSGDAAQTMDDELFKEDIVKGLELLRSDKFEEGEEVLRTVLSRLEELTGQDSANAVAFQQKGQVLFYLQKDGEAVAAFDRAVALDDKNHKSYFFKGLIARINRDLVEAEKCLRKACGIMPKNVDYWFEFGQVLIDTDQLEEAAIAMKKVLEIEPDNLKALSELGGISVHLNDLKAAYALLSKVVAKDPGFGLALYNLGQTCQTMGKHEEALEHFLRFSETRPDDWRPITKIVQECQALGKMKERDKHRKRLFDLRKKGKIDSLSQANLYCRDQFSVKDHGVMALEYFELEGEMAVRFSFHVRDRKTGKTLFKISLGSYESTNAFARGAGEIEEDERLFHLDGYFENSHTTYGMFKGEPGYDDVREMVVKIIEEELEKIPAIEEADADK